MLFTERYSAMALILFSPHLPCYVCSFAIPFIILFQLGPREDLSWLQMTFFNETCVQRGTSRQNGLTIHSIPYDNSSHTWLPRPIFCHSQPLLLVYLCVKFSCCLLLFPESTWIHPVGVIKFQIFRPIPYVGIKFKF